MSHHDVICSEYESNHCEANTVPNEVNDISIASLDNRGIGEELEELEEIRKPYTLVCKGKRSEKRGK